jgi:hypothetical protein
MTRELSQRIRSVIAREEPRLRAIGPEAAAAARAPGKWSIAQVLGHLIDSAANNHQRFVRAQLVENLVISGYAQNEWASTQAYDREPWNDLIDLWASFNRHLAHVVQHVPDASLSHTVTLLTANGEKGPTMSLEALIADYVRHLEHHLEQI